ncbi:MAG: hypothetical protein QNJ00_05340 [Woeseiaceae bacterium]|nr:hypothetical protein [Woeseiaceae bacterium]
MRRLAILVIALAATGCAHYTTPGGAVSLAGIDDADIAEAFERRPAASFPANIATVRIQERGYPNAAAKDLGAFSVVSVRDLETDEAAARIAKLDKVRGVAPLSTLLMPPTAAAIGDLRPSAAQLQADLLLVYTVDTLFTIDGSDVGPLSVISLGMLRDRSASVTATVAGILIDVRTGFIYGAIEASATEEQRASAWTSSAKTDAARIRAEKAAFAAYVGEFEGFWPDLLVAHARPYPPGRRYYVEDR